jgi:hypothetical protein
MIRRWSFRAPDGRRITIHDAETWFAARLRAAVKLGCNPVDLDEAIAVDCDNGQRTDWDRCSATASV